MLAPGAVIAILGDGQLGRMLAIEARRMGYVVWAVGPNQNGAAATVVDRHVHLPLDAARAIAQLARDADVVTFETEHVPRITIDEVSGVATLVPAAEALTTLQDRLTQKRALSGWGVPVANFLPVQTLADIAVAADQLGLPVICKTRHGGYDGRGQVKFVSHDDLHATSGPGSAWLQMGEPLGVAEAFVTFEREVSVILARDVYGHIETFPIAQNIHHDHVLRFTHAPAQVPQALAQRARELATSVAENLRYVGVLAVELFMTPSGDLLCNEVAPRVHNSGHFTLGQASASQFEQHIRAICGLPLAHIGDTCPTVMANLLGDLWQGGQPDWLSLLEDPLLQLHLYGKGTPAKGRKMGHFAVRAPDVAQAAKAAEQHLAALEAGAMRSR